MYPIFFITYVAFLYTFWGVLKTLFLSSIYYVLQMKNQIGENPNSVTNVNP